MNGKVRRWAWATLVMVLITAISMGAVADEEASPTRVVVTGVSDDGGEIVLSELRQVPNVDLRSESWFVGQVESRAFNPDRILDQPSDLGWVMDGADIDLVIVFDEASDEDFQVRFIGSDGGKTEREFLADRGSDGSIRRGGVMLVRHELEEYLGADTTSTEPSEPVAEAGQSQPEGADDVDELSDSEAFRRQAAAEHEALRELYERDMFWMHVYGRFLQIEDPGVLDEAVNDFFGFELDAELFPFGATDPDRAQAGFYMTYTHNFNSFFLIEESGGETVEYDVFVQDFGVETGTLYRLESPLDESNFQLRLKAGMRYNQFRMSNFPLETLMFESADEEEEDDDELETSSLSMSRVSLVLGTRATLPLTGALAFAVDVDVMPIAFLRHDLDDVDTFTFGFGGNAGIQVQAVEDRFHVSAGYSFRLYQSRMDLGDQDFPSLISYELNHGLRAGLIFQY